MILLFPAVALAWWYGREDAGWTTDPLDDPYGESRPPDPDVPPVDGEAKEGWGWYEDENGDWIPDRLERLIAAGRDYLPSAGDLAYNAGKAAVLWTAVTGACFYGLAKLARVL